MPFSIARVTLASALRSVRHEKQQALPMGTIDIAASSSIDRTGAARRLRIAAWVTTGAFALMMTFSGILYLVGPPAIVTGIQHLGYPPYFVRLLGIAKLLGVAAILAPRTRTLREWGYAGFTFDLVAATASHLLSGDGVAHAAPATFSLALGLASYFLRRTARRNGAGA